MNDAKSRVAGPAIGLIVVSCLSMLLLCLALAFDVWLLTSGTAARMGERRGSPQETVIAVRMIWSALIVATNLVILAGAAQLFRLRAQYLATAACILSLIPVLGPCFVFGIPFGIWGLLVLRHPQVRAGFAAESANRDP